MIPDRWITIISVAIGVLGVIVGAVLSIWAVRVTKRIARESRLGKAPRLRLSLGNLEVESGKRLRVGFGIDEDERRMTLLILPITIQNVGSRAIEAVDIHIAFPAGVSTEKAVLEAKGFQPGAERARAKIGERVHAYYHFRLFGGIRG